MAFGSKLLGRWTPWKGVELTLILTMNGPETIWLLADRRLSVNDVSVKEDARKLMFLETTDGVAILGYAGLGATLLGTEPADWMSNVLRGRNMPLVQSLHVLKDAIVREMPRHVAKLAGQGVVGHTVMATAFLGEEAMFYTIDLVFLPGRRQFQYRFTRHVLDKPAHIPVRTHRTALGGSGALALATDLDWRRPLYRLLKACDRKLVSPHAVADHMAALNLRVSGTVPSVGPRCIVAWRHRKGGVHRGGGGTQFYNGTSREGIGPNGAIPTIGAGIDLIALSRVLMEQGREQMLASPPRGTQIFPPAFDHTKLNEALKLLPDSPDEKLK